MKSISLKDMTTVMGRIPPDTDLLEELERLAKEFNITTGYIKGIGAVRQANIGYFDQKKGVYIQNTIDRPMEIVSLMANISIKDDKPFVHAHIALGDRDGRVFGGHLLPGTKTFVFEYVLTYGSTEEPLIRVRDDKLNLDLWPTD